MSFLRNYGAKLLDLGYEIVPIKPGFKYPEGLKQWETVEATPALLDRWLSNGFAQGGVGILTRNTPAVDFDIQDQEVIDLLIAWCEKEIGPTVQRTGNAPKTLLVYRTEEPFPKAVSRKFEDMFGQIHRLEILGDGQQFVAFADHPDTGKPYEWVSASNLAEIPAEELKPITAEQAHRLIEYFESIVPDDWEAVASAKTSKTVDWSLSEGERALLHAKPKANVSTAEISKCLNELASDDYHEWVKVGMALFHQFDGDFDGFELWDTWSQESDKYDEKACRSRWNTFRANLSRHDPVTFASVIRDARESYKARKATEARKGFHFLPVSQVLSKLGPVNWQVEGLIEANTTGVLFGDPGSYKSFLAIDLALHCATGQRWHGANVKQGPVAYIVGEGHNGLARRFSAWFNHHNETPEHAPIVVSSCAAPLTDEDTAEAVSEAIEQSFKETPPAMIIIDTLARNFGAADENSTTDMGRFVDNVDRLLRAKFGCCVLIVHHTGHSNKDRARGASPLLGGSDFQYRVDKPQEGVAKIICCKMKDAPEPQDLYLETLQVDIEMPNGEEADSLVLVKSEQTFDPVPENPLKGKQKALYELIEHEEEITRDKLREVAIAEGICKDAAGFRRQLNTLKDKGYIEETDDVIRPNPIF